MPVVRSGNNRMSRLSYSSKLKMVPMPFEPALTGTECTWQRQPPSHLVANTNRLSDVIIMGNKRSWAFMLTWLPHFIHATYQMFVIGLLEEYIQSASRGERGLAPCMVLSQSAGLPKLLPELSSSSSVRLLAPLELLSISYKYMLAGGLNSSPLINSLAHCGLLILSFIRWGRIPEDLKVNCG